MTAPLVITSIYPLSWHLSEAWSMRKAPFVSYSATERGAPAYAGGDPVAVIVATSDRLDLAARTWPRAKLIWFLDNATHTSSDPRVSSHLALNESIARAAKVHTPVHVIPLAFAPRPRFGWTPRKLWSMQNCRDTPTTPNVYRRANQEILDSILIRKPGLLGSHTLYGIGQIGGPLYPRDKERMYAASSAYVAALRSTAGLSLGSHEAMAAGCPLVGNLWPGIGDHGGMLGGVSASLDRVAEIAARACEDERYARDLGEQGIEFIRAKRSQAIMDRAIERFLDELSALPARNVSRLAPVAPRKAPTKMREIAPGSFVATGRKPKQFWERLAANKRK
jgi:hypothetical protein